MMSEWMFCTSCEADFIAQDSDCPSCPLCASLRVQRIPEADELDGFDDDEPGCLFDRAAS